MLVYPEQAVTVAGKPGASSNRLSAGAAVGVTVAVVVVGVAAAVVWMWRRQLVLPCASNADRGEFYHSFTSDHLTSYLIRTLLQPSACLGLSHGTPAGCCIISNAH